MDLCKFEKVFVVSQMYEWMDGRKEGRNDR